MTTVENKLLGKVVEVIEIGVQNLKAENAELREENDYLKGMIKEQQETISKLIAKLP